MRVERQFNLTEAEHDPSEVLEVMCNLSKQAIHKDDWRSNGRSGEKTMLAGRRDMDGSMASQSPRVISRRKFLMIEGLRWFSRRSRSTTKRS